MNKYLNIGSLIICLMTMMCATAMAQNTEAANTELLGNWSGELKVNPQIKLKLVLHIEENSVSLDSPDQGAYGIPGEIVYLSADSVNVTVPKIMAAFAGRLKEGSIVGEFKQGPMRLPLTLTKGVKKANRPQTPMPPFPYTTEDLTINTHDGVIAGTLTIPEKADNKTPLVVLVTGSGPQNRDEELFEHKPFAVIADWLARNGIASFRYDDRGVGESTGDLLSATTSDFADDAEVVVNYLRHMNRFGKVGIVGHSEGGLIAYIIGAKPETVDFIVSIAGPAVKGSRTIGYQNKKNLLKSGIPEKETEDFVKALEAMFDYKVGNPGTVDVSDELLTRLYPQRYDSPITQQLCNTLKMTLQPEASNPWMMYFLGYDPASDLSGVNIPTLIIYGEKDQQVPPSLNADLARQLAPNAHVMVFPDLNHLMQRAKTGDPSEYKEIEETISPEVLEAITTFIKNCAEIIL